MSNNISNNYIELNIEAIMQKSLMVEVPEQYDLDELCKEIQNKIQTPDKIINDLVNILKSRGIIVNGIEDWAIKDIQITEKI